MTGSKIKTLEELAPLLGNLRAQGKIVVQCHGVFDLLHPGHIKHFESAKREGDLLVVTVTPDRFVNKGPGRPVFPERQRIESIASLDVVDYVALTETPTAPPVIEALKPTVFAKGQDLAEAAKDPNSLTSEERRTVERYGGRMISTNEPIVWSSSDLLTNYFSNYPEETKSFLADLRNRYSRQSFLEAIGKMRTLRTLVIGDAILDVYHYCSPLGRSLKEEIMRVKVEESVTYAGGAVAVANTVAGFCDDVDLVTLLGRQDLYKEQKNETFIRQNLRPNVLPRFFYRDDAPTVLNERFVEKVFLKKFFGSYQIKDDPLPPSQEAALAAELAPLLPQYDIVLVMDYGLGFLGENLVRTIAEKAPFLAVNTQTNSVNIGYHFISRYPRADYISISQPEIRMAYQRRNTPIEELATDLWRRSGARMISVTLGHQGSLLYDGKFFQRSPALSQKVVDRIGAGDAYFTVSAMAARLGLPADMAGFLGNVAGAIACSTVVNQTTVDRDALARFTETLLK